MNGILAVLENQFGRLIVAAFACAVLICGPAYADSPPPLEFNAARVIEELGKALAEGRKDTAVHLSRLGFAPQVDELRKVDNVPIHAFSPRTMIEGLYRRAEIQKAGEGNRFLAVLYLDTAERSAAMAIDPDFEALRNYPSESLDLKRHPIVFASLEAVTRTSARAPLPAVVERAINKIAQHYSGRGLAQARAVVLKNFRKSGFDGRKFERVLAESSSSPEVWRRLLAIGTPPPRADVALRGILIDAMAGSAALSSDAVALAAMEELSRDLPPEYERYTQSESKLKSRIAQAEEAARLNQIDRTRTNDTVAIIGLIGDDFPPEPKMRTPNTDFGPDAGSESPTTPSPEPPKPGPSPSHPNKPINPEARAFAERYGNYIKETMTPSGSLGRSGLGSEISPGTPRVYRTAIRSARAGRGVSVGGQVQTDLKGAPLRAVWLSNRKDDRLGRLFVEFKGNASKPGLIGASRVLFADSFYAAISALWGRHDNNAHYKNCDILILMSMDPKSAVLASETQETLSVLLSKLNAGERARMQHILKDMETLQARAEAGGDNNFEALSILIKTQALNEMETLIKTASDRLDAVEEAKFKELQGRRGIVLHPAIVGRELSWSTARIDFWFNRLEALSREAAAMNGGRTMPEALRKIKLRGRADTWQYFEFDSRISLGKLKGRTAPLVVTSVATDGSNPASHAAAVRSHFGISMFGPEPGPKGIKVEDGLYRVDDLEAQVQPMLDWLATNHHDFMRLNDFSEAFSLLRWLNSANVQITIIDMDGQGPAIATPDRVQLEAGPKTGK
ncbi:MAG: hypothetical protein ACKVP2_16330 [Burkholderiales bacterium]